MPLLIRTIFPFQYIENTVSGPGTNCNNLVNSSVINDSVSTPNFFTSNGYRKYLFDNTLHKFLYNIFIKNRTSDNQEKANLNFSSVFPDGKEVYNRQKYKLTSITHYLRTATPQLLSFKQKIQSLVRITLMVLVGPFYQIENKWRKSQNIFS